MRLTKNIVLTPIIEIANENFSFIEMSRKLMWNNEFPRMRAEVYTIEFIGIGLRIFVEKGREEIPKVEPIKKINITDMEQINKGEKYGEGTIFLQTLKKGDEFVTSSKFEFSKISTEGAISELKKIIKKLEKDLDK